MENAALLARVSTKGQEDNSSPEAQLQRGRIYCTSKKYNIVIERVETMSGAFVLARSVYNELLNLAADGRISVIVVDIPDRLGRGDAIAKLELMAQLNGARVEYAQPGRDTSTVEGLIQHSAEQMVSGIERMNIRRRTTGGKYDWVKRGRVIATSRRPYGYEFMSKRDERGHKVSCELVIVPEEAEIVRRLFQMVVYELMTTRRMAVRLNSEGIPSPQGKTWHRSTIHRILTSETYKGLWRYGKYAQRRIDTPGKVVSEQKKRDIEETVTAPCPSIVDEGLWDMAQRQLEQNERYFCKPTKHTYLLRGRIQCKCGRTLCGGFFRSGRGDETNWSGCKGFRYYTCSRKYEVDGTHCDSGSLRAGYVERAVWQIICEEMQDIDRLIAGVKQQQAHSGEARRAIEQAIAATQIQIERANDKLKRYRKLYGDGNLSEADYIEEKRGIDNEIRKRQKEMQDWQLRLKEHPDLNPDFETELRRFKEEIASRLTPETPLNRQSVLIEMLDVRCRYDHTTGILTVSGLMGEHTLSLESQSPGNRGRLPVHKTLLLRLDIASSSIDPLDLRGLCQVPLDLNRPEIPCGFPNIAPAPAVA